MGFSIVSGCRELQITGGEDLFSRPASVWNGAT